MLKELEDRELMIRIRDRNQEAFAELFDRHASLLLGLTRRVLGGDLGEAEDIVQEALIQAWHQADRYNEKRSSVVTWLVMIARSRAIDRLRSRGVRQRAADRLKDESSNAHESAQGFTSVLHDERRERLLKELSQLPPEQRNVLELAFFGGLSQRQISNREGIPLGTVKTRTLLAMRKLRKTLSEDLKALL